jgi:prepilin-type N-terminal cleavage/methylation domain-containing protein
MPILSNCSKTSPGQSGFTLIETVISMVLLAIIAMGVASLFSYSISATSSASDREMAGAVAQQRMEQLRSVAFDDSSLSATSADGITTTVKRLGRNYSVVTIISDTGLQGSTITQKTITVKVKPLATTAQALKNASTLYASVTLITTRTTQSMGPNRSL